MSSLKDKLDAPKVDLTEPSLPGLAYLLRHRELWPAGFKWFYPDVNRCAVGLFAAKWGYPHGRKPLRALMKWDEDAYASIFMNIFRSWRPEGVANRIDKYLARVQN